VGDDDTRVPRPFLRAVHALQGMGESIGAWQGGGPAAPSISSPHAAWWRSFPVTVRATRTCPVGP